MNRFAPKHVVLAGALAASLAPGIPSRAGTERPADVQWTQGGGAANGAYYSPLADVAKGNVARLGLAWEFDDFVVRGRTHRGMEATPLVVDGVMYVTGPWSVVYALDARNGRELWRFDPEVAGDYARHGCCDAVNRGVAIAKGVVYVATFDGYLVALDARTGHPLWKRDTFVDRTRSYTITGAPRLAGNNVVIGNGGAEMGVRGYVSAYDAKSGKLAWRFFVVPGADPAQDTPELAIARKTWSKQSRWDLGGGGTVWDSIVFDAETGSVLIGTGNGMPHPVWTRSPGGGDNLYLSSIVALDAETGRMKWYYQTTPSDSWDYTATQNMILADLVIDGRTRKVVIQAPKNGFFYVIDRVTGQFISAQKYTTATWADSIDQRTGRPILSTTGDFSKTTKLVWPSEGGGHNWHPMALSPQTGLAYIPVIEAPMRYTRAPVEYRPFSHLQGSIAVFPPFDGIPASLSYAATAGGEDAGPMRGQPKPTYQSVLKAWDPVKQTLAWASQPGIFWNGGVLATGGGLVLQGGMDGKLTIYDAANGAVLRRIDIGTAIMAAPMTYAIDGVQYVAITAGLGGGTNVFYPSGSAARTWQNSERLLVLKLGGGAVTLPPAVIAPPVQPVQTRYQGTPDQATRGAVLYAQNCARCHASKGGGGGYPDLWNMSAETHEVFRDIVRDGAYANAGMAGFGDILSGRDIDDIHAYVSRR